MQSWLDKTKDLPTKPANEEPKKSKRGGSAAAVNKTDDGDPAGAVPCMECRKPAFGDDQVHAYQVLPCVGLKDDLADASSWT